MIFSIIIPVYNVAPYLRACLDSVCAAVENVERLNGCKVEKLGGGVEVICVDDGSTDGSAEILNEYAARFNSSTFQLFNLSTFQPFKVVHQENRGVSAARNCGLEIARGDYVCFLDSDDTYNPKFLEVIEKLVEQYNPDVIKTNSISVRSHDEDADPIDFRVKVACYDMRRPGEYDAALRFVFAGLGANNGCFRRSVLKGVRFSDLVCCEDLLFGVEAFQNARTLLVVKTPTWNYLLRDGSAMSRRSLPYCVSMLKAYARMWELTDAWRMCGFTKQIIVSKTRSSIAVAMQMISDMAKPDQSAAWKVFWEKTVRLYEKGGLVSAPLVPVFGFAFRIRSATVASFLVSFPHRIRVFLLRSDLVVWLKDRIRGSQPRGTVRS